MKRVLLSIAALFVAGIASQSARADSFFLEGANGATPPCTTIAPCAEVTLTGGGTSVTFTVSSLDSGYVFDTFGFNGPSGLTLGTSSGEVSSPTLKTTQQEDGWGSFAYEFDTGKSGGSSGGDCTVTSGTPSAGCTFTFTVNGSGLTLSQFEVASTGDTNGTTDFAGHMASSAASGFAGESVPVPTAPTPEPSSLLLLGTGIFGIAGIFRRKMVSLVN